MKDFKKLKVWSQGMEIAKEVYKISEKIRKEHHYELVSQITRCSISVPTNIAEGCSRRSTKENYRFFEIALGSAFELETQLILTIEFQLLNRQVGEALLEKVREEQKMLSGLMKSLGRL